MQAPELGPTQLLMVFSNGRSLSDLASEANHKDAFVDWLNSTIYIDYKSCTPVVNWACD